MRDGVDLDHPLADRLGDCGTQEKGSDEIEEGGPHHGQLRREHASGDDGGDAVGGVVKSIEEIENQRDQDSDDEEQKVRIHPFGSCDLGCTASGILQDDGFEHVGDVFRLVGCGFQELEQFLDLDQRDGVGFLFEQARDGDARNLVGFVFQAVDFDATGENAVRFSGG